MHLLTRMIAAYLSAFLAIMGPALGLLVALVAPEGTGVVPGLVGATLSLYIARQLHRASKKRRA